MTTQTKKEQYATCEECERYCYTGGEHKEGKGYICEDCEEYSCDNCGHQFKNEEEWAGNCDEHSCRYCECDCSDCAEEEEKQDNDRAFHFKNELDNLWRKIEKVGKAFGEEYDRRVCELIPKYFAIDDLLDLDDDEGKAQLFALVQANFTKEEVFPEDKPIGISDSVSDAVGRQVETLEAENQALRNENLKLQQQLQAIKSLLHAN